MIIISSILSIIFYFNVMLILCIMHVVQIICLRIFGYQAHKVSIDVINFLLLNNMRVLGYKIEFKGLENIPDGPIVVLSNHQSTWDIPPLFVKFRKNHLKFIAKKELGKGIPSISYNLKHGGSVLIDRNSPSQSIKQVITMAKRVKEKGFSACIFPEGTRSRNGKLGKFQPSGVKTLLKFLPDTPVVPFVIHNNCAIEKKTFPLPLGLHLTYEVLPPIDRTAFSNDDITMEAKRLIAEKMGQ